MKFRMRHTAPAVIVAVALGAGSALLATSAGGGAVDAKPSLATVESSEQADLGSAPLVPEAWGAVIDYESLAAENGELPEQAGLARGSLVPEAWGALIDYESLAAVAR
jgi:hypothetical protein